MSAVFHNAQINLRSPAEKIGASNYPQIIRAVGNQLCFGSENFHEELRKKLRAGKKDCRNYHGKPQNKSQYPLYRIRIAFSPVLCRKHACPDGKSRKKQIKYKHHLSCQRYRRQGILIQLSQHYRVRSAYKGQHKLLKGNGKHESDQLAVKFILLSELPSHHSLPHRIFP